MILKEWLINSGSAQVQTGTLQTEAHAEISGEVHQQDSQPKASRFQVRSRPQVRQGYLKSLCLLAVFSFACLPLGPARAIPLNFDFTTAGLGVAGGQAYNSVTMSVDGVSVEVTAYTIDNDGAGTILASSLITAPGRGVYVSANNNLGVSSGNGDSNNLDGGDANTTEPDEGLLFSFSELVSLAFVDFDSWGSSDDFNLTVDGTLILADFDGHPHGGSPYAAHRPSNSSYFDFYNITGRDFLFWADGDSDSFRIDSMVVNTVPTPASLTLLGLGVLGFKLRRGKRDSQAATPASLDLA